MKVKCESEVTQSCPTLCDPMDCSLPGSSVHGIFQKRVLEWVAIAFSKKKKKSDTCSLFPPFGDPWPSFLLASQHAFLSSIHPFLGSSILKNEDFPDGAVVKNPSAMQETQRYRFSFWVRKIPEVGNGSTIQYSCLGNPTDRGAWWATDHQIAKNWTRLND